MSSHNASGVYLPHILQYGGRNQHIYPHDKKIETPRMPHSLSYTKIEQCKHVRCDNRHNPVKKKSDFKNATLTVIY